MRAIAPDTDPRGLPRLSVVHNTCSRRVGPATIFGRSKRRRRTARRRSATGRCCGRSPARLRWRRSPAWSGRSAGRARTHRSVPLVSPATRFEAADEKRRSGRRRSPPHRGCAVGPARRRSPCSPAWSARSAGRARTRRRRHWCRPRPDSQHPTRRRQTARRRSALALDCAIALRAIARYARARRLAGLAVVDEHVNQAVGVAGHQVRRVRRNATNRPSALSPENSQLAWAPSLATLTRVVWPVWRSRTNTSVAPLVSPATSSTPNDRRRRTARRVRTRPGALASLGALARHARAGGLPRPPRRAGDDEHHLGRWLALVPSLARNVKGS